LDANANLQMEKCKFKNANCKMQNANWKMELLGVGVVHTPKDSRPQRFEVRTVDPVNL
jgi:hypothetical protein